MAKARSDYGPSRQRTIYLEGVGGRKPIIPLDPDELARKSAKVMSPRAFAYIAGGAGVEDTVSRNRKGFHNWQIVPRMLRNVEERDCTVELLGHRLPAPVLLSPVGALEMVHNKADLMVAKAAAATRIPMIFSNQASQSMESCASLMGDSPRWFQLYWSKSDELVKSLLARAESVGCTAIVVTLDTTLLGWRTRDLDLAYLPFLRGKGIAQYVSDPVFQQLMDKTEEGERLKPRLSLEALSTLFQSASAYPGNFFTNLLSGKPLKAVRTFINVYSRPSLSWDELSLLREYTRLPVLLKGILHPDDARKALDYGMDGIIVSNHGGRQLDGAISSIEALPGIIAVVKGRIPVLIDSGIRGGADMFKAIALGARAVCIGRPFAYGLAIAGQAGVEEVIRNLIADFDLTMGLAGCKNLDEITPDLLRKPDIS